MADIDRKPIFLMDIDGVLNIFGDTDIPDEHLIWRRALGYTLKLHRRHRIDVRRFEQHFEMKWATMWQADSSYFAAQAGFGHHWDYVDFDGINSSQTDQRTGYGIGSYKHAGIVRALENRWGVWVDDDMTPEQQWWAEERTLWGIPTLFVKTNPAVGLTAEQTHEILAFWRKYDASHGERSRSAADSSADGF